MRYALSLATPSDANAIAHVLYTPERIWSILLRGPVPLDNIKAQRARKFEETLRGSSTKIIVAKAEETEEIVAFGEWQLLEEEVVVPTKVEREQQLSSFLESLDSRMNLELISEIFWKLGQLQIDVLNGQKHWFLNNLATLLGHRRQGLGARLIEWPLEMADKEGLSCFLTTEADGEGRRLYEKYGFQYTLEAVIDLGKYGGKGSVTYIGMIRLPKTERGSPLKA